MGYDFDRIINRNNTRSFKWDQTSSIFGGEDILPLWVADMDFESPPAVKEALVKRAAQGVYGYTNRTDDYVEAITSWFSRRHGWKIEPEWLTDTPGVVLALSVAIELFSNVGDKVILQSPVYFPFYDVIQKNGREVVCNPLVLQGDCYLMDYVQLEQLMKDGARLMLLCNPHNPVGRVWKREELEHLQQLCLKYGVIVISDEIHCDIVMPGHTHTPFASLSSDIAKQTVTCTAPTKTFNLAGLQSAFVVIPNAELKAKFDARIETLHLKSMNYFNEDAVTAAYNEGEEWLDELLIYLQGNVDYAINYMNEHLPEVKPFRPEGTILLWVDCRSLGLDIDGLKQLMYQKARVAFIEGSVFGKEAEGYLRINLACPRSILHEALERFCGAASKGS